MIRTDHKPLIYLNHMKRVDDHLLQTVEDLAVGHYELEYLPGKANVVADCLSWSPGPWVIPVYMVKEPFVQSNIDDQFQVIPVAGGSNSLFLALNYSMFSRFDEASSLRELIVGQILSDPVRYGFTKSARDMKLIQIMNSAQVFVPFPALQAFVDASHGDARVCFDSGLYVRVTGKGNTQFVNVKCCGGVHFNGLELRSSSVKPKLIAPHSISREGAFTSSVSDKNESGGRLVYGSASCSVTAEYGKNVDPLHIGDDREVILMHHRLDDEISLLSGVIVGAGGRDMSVGDKSLLAGFRPYMQNFKTSDGLLVHSRKLQGVL